jgi:hypothetical protein
MVGGRFPSPASMGFDSSRARHGAIVQAGERCPRTAEIRVRVPAAPRDHGRVVRRLASNQKIVGPTPTGRSMQVRQTGDALRCQRSPGEFDSRGLLRDHVRPGRTACECRLQPGSRGFDSLPGLRALVAQRRERLASIQQAVSLNLTGAPTPGSSTGKDAGFSVQRHEFESRTGCHPLVQPEAGTGLRSLLTRFNSERGFTSSSCRTQAPVSEAGCPGSTPGGEATCSKDWLSNSAS